MKEEDMKNIKNLIQELEDLHTKIESCLIRAQYRIQLLKAIPDIPDEGLDKEMD